MQKALSESFKNIPIFHGLTLDNWKKILGDFDPELLARISRVDKFFYQLVQTKLTDRIYLKPFLQQRLKTYDTSQVNYDSPNGELLFKIIKLQHIMAESKEYPEIFELIESILNDNNLTEENISLRMAVNLMTAQLIIDPQLNYYKQQNLCEYGLSALAKVHVHYPNDINLCFVAAAYWSITLQSAVHDVTEYLGQMKIQAPDERLQSRFIKHSEEYPNLLTSSCYEDANEFIQRSKIIEMAKKNFENYLTHGVKQLNDELQDFFTTNPALQFGLAHPHIYNFLTQLLKCVEERSREELNVLSAQKIYKLASLPYRKLFEKENAGELICSSSDRFAAICNKHGFFNGKAEMNGQELKDCKNNNSKRSRDGKLIDEDDNQRDLKKNKVDHQQRYSYKS